MINVILVLVIVAVVGGALVYIIRAKKKGAKCIGCSASDCCSSKAGKNHSDHPKHDESTSCGCGCGCHDSK